MKSDYQDWGELQQRATHILSKKILGIKPILQLMVQTSSDDDFRIDLIQEREDSYRLEKLVWKKKIDNHRMNDPLEKIKLFGHFAPTFTRESFMLNENSSSSLLNLIENIMGNDTEFKKMENPIVLDGVKNHLKINYSLKETEVSWEIDPKDWKTIPALRNLLFKLSNSVYHDE